MLYRYNSFLLEQRRKTLREKLAKKERKKEKKRKRILKAGGVLPAELEVSNDDVNKIFLVCPQKIVKPISKLTNELATY